MKTNLKFIFVFSNKLLQNFSYESNITEAQFIVSQRINMRMYKETFYFI